jgi:hypothetical protein
MAWKSGEDLQAQSIGKPGFPYVLYLKSDDIKLIFYIGRWLGLLRFTQVYSLSSMSFPFSLLKVPHHPGHSPPSCHGFWSQCNQLRLVRQSGLTVTPTVPVATVFPHFYGWNQPIGPWFWNKWNKSPLCWRLSHLETWITWLDSPVFVGDFAAKSPHVWEKCPVVPIAPLNEPSSMLHLDGPHESCSDQAQFVT